MLNTTAEGRHALLIDDSPVPFDVTQFFEFDHGGTDTSGVLTYPLPDLPAGGHIDPVRGNTQNSQRLRPGGQ